MIRIREWTERRRMLRERAAAGYTSLRITKKTRELAAELKRLALVRSDEELVYELVSAELERTRKELKARRIQLSDV